MFAALTAIGLTRGRWVSQARWVLLWFSASFLLAALMVTAYFAAPGAVEFIYGLALGYVAAVTVHTWHHATDGSRRAQTAVEE